MTMAENDLQVIVKAKELAAHSFRLTSNSNRYPKKYRHSLVDRIQLKSLDLYELLLEANRTSNVTRKRERCETITKAITVCDQLLFYIELSMNLDLWLCDLFIDSTDGKGLPLGNQINQGFALLYLDGMDKLIQRDLGIAYYGRYMDDFYLIHESKDYLRHCLEVIAEHLKALGLELNGKTQIFPFKNGVSFLGFHTYVSKSGKVVRRLKNQNKRNAQKKLVRMARLAAEGKLPRERFDASYTAWKNHISRGNCVGLAREMDAKINEILDLDKEKREGRRKK